MTTSTLDQLNARAAIHMVELNHTQDGHVATMRAVAPRFVTLEPVAARLDQFEGAAK